jgi:hypothetical protein
VFFTFEAFVTTHRHFENYCLLEVIRSTVKCEGVEGQGEMNKKKIVKTWRK